MNNSNVFFLLLFSVWIQMFSVVPVGKMLSVWKSLLAVTMQCYLVNGSLNICKVREIKCSLGKLRKSRMSASPFVQVKSQMTFPVILIRASSSVETEWWFQYLQWNAKAEAGDCESRQYFNSEEIQDCKSGSIFPQTAWVPFLGSCIILSLHLCRWNCGPRGPCTMLPPFPHLSHLLPLLVSQAVVLGQSTLSRMLLCCIAKKDVPSSLRKSLFLRYLRLISIHNVSQVTPSPRKLDLWLSTQVKCYCIWELTSEYSVW